MGKASPIARIRIPKFPAKFDVIENLKRVFQVAFSLNFHLPPNKGDKFDTSNIATLGFAIDPTPNSEIGKGSLTDLAGPLTGFEAVPIIGSAVSGLGGVPKFEADPVTGHLPESPWQKTVVQANSTRLATIVAGAMLENGSADAFKALMEGTLPKGAPTLSSKLASEATTLSQLVFAITTPQSSNSDQTALQDAASLYGDIFADPTVRLNIKAAVDFCKTFTLVGAPPDWIQVSVLRDIIPWSGQFLYELLAKIQALSDAYRGVLDEISAFIDLVERKINTLERFIEYLVSILDFINSLSAGFFILNVPVTNGDASTWGLLIDSAGGTKPPSGPGGYTGGIALAYVAPDVGAFVDAFKLIF